MTELVLRARCILVLGTGRGAGTSWLVTALCRWYAARGLKVAPFKVLYEAADRRTVDGGQIGPDVYLQALAAHAKPGLCMNPLLVRQDSDGSREVTLLGEVQQGANATEPLASNAALWPPVLGALDALRAAHDVVVIDGGSAPADGSTAPHADLALARHTDARILLVAAGDGEPSDPFAHLHGSWSLLDASDRARIDGFVCNRCETDAVARAPAVEALQAHTGVPTVASIPLHIENRLHTQRSAFEERGSGSSDARIAIGILRGPKVGNLDEFRPLQCVADVHVVWVERPEDLHGIDWVVLPGSTDTTADLAWLRATGLDRAVCVHAERGGAVLGVCAGLQLLGEALVDPEHIEGNAAGLGLLPLVTRFEPEETMARTQVTFQRLGGVWQPLSGLAVEGYQVHHGQTGHAHAAQHPAMAAAGDIARAVLPNGLGWQNGAGNVLGTYLHGLFEDAHVVRALFGADACTLHGTFDRIADCIDAAFAPDVLEALHRAPDPRGAS